MRKKIYLLFTFFIGVWSLTAQVYPTLKVVGPELRKVNGSEVVLKGVNYNLLDDGAIYLTQNAQTYMNYIDQVALTGSNSIRIPWFTNKFNHWRKDYPNTGTPQSALDGGQLSNLIGYCYTKGLIPILELHDYTCDNNWTNFSNEITNWWLQPSVLNLINSHKEYLIINIANEFGKVRWTNNQTQSLNTFKTHYQALITSLRSAGVHVPIMIDAPDCGQSSTELLSIADDLLIADPQSNLIFSAHTYWYGYAGNVNSVDAKINEIVAADVCFVFGEVSNRQDVTGNPADGVYNLDAVYKRVLLKACENRIGRLVWAFNHDWHTDREMSPTSNVNNLTPFGNDVLYNPVYGFINGSCETILNTEELAIDLKIYPNPTSDFLYTNLNFHVNKIIIYNEAGKVVKTLDEGFDKIDLTLFNSGIYYLNIYTSTNVITHAVVKK